MAAHFTLTLDTTAPGGVTLSIDAGAATTTDQSVDLAIATSDGDTTSYQMKVWGSVDPAADAQVQTTEGASAWIAFSTSKTVTVSTGDGLKTLNVKVRDDVFNESSAASDTITLDTTAPTVDITVAADRTRVSKQATRDTSIFSWAADEAFTEYKVKVVPATNSLHTAGTQIPTTAGSTNVSGTGSFPASTNIETQINGTDLETASTGDGAKIIKVFVLANGTWSV